MKYMPENWWQKKRGVYMFIDELFKFVYYLLNGYIPIKSLLMSGTLIFSASLRNESGLSTNQPVN
jgi:hypothetical protein